MINFFRKIRKQLADDNKPLKYMRYAIGEIVLVVIGILIALSINNWNQEKNDNKLSRDYLYRIQRDIIQDTVSFNEIIKYNDSLRNEIKELLVFVYSEIDNVEQVVHLCSTYDLALNQIFSPDDNTYRGMISSGALTLIKNLDLREAIAKLYSEYDLKRSLFKSNKDWMDGIAIIVDTKTDLLKFSKDINDIYKQPKMLNEKDFAFLNNPEDEKFKIVVRGISATAWNQKVSNEYYKELINNGQEVLDLIEEELK